MKPREIIDVLSIILPALIIILGVVRLFVNKSGWVNGLITLMAVLLLMGGLVRYFILGSGGGGRSNSNNGPKPVPVSVSKHSNLFNQSMEKVMTAYYNLAGAFVKNDTILINKSGTDLKQALDSFAIQELQVDTIIYQTALQPFENAKSETGAILANNSLNEKRGSFNILSSELFSLLNTARYDLEKVYWQECSAAFGEDKPGNWLSRVEEAENPYGQKSCRELKTTIDFVPAAPAAADTTKMN